MIQLDLMAWNPRPCPKSMPEATATVLQKLRKAGMRGITWDDLPKGFALRSRIADLRKQGHTINTYRDHLEGGTIRARYVLMNQEQ